MKKISFFTIILIIFIWTLSISYAFKKSQNNRKFNHYQLEITKNQIIISKYIKIIRPELPCILRNGIAFEIAKQSKQNNLPWKLITAIIKVESYFNPTAISEVSAKGLMQIYTLECKGIIFDESKLFNIRYNIMCGICIFLEKLRIAKGDWYKAIMLYNGQGQEAIQYQKKVIITIKEIIQFNNTYNNLRII